MKNPITCAAAVCFAALVLLTPPALAQDESDASWEIQLHDVSDLSPITLTPMYRDVGTAGPFRVWTSHYQPSEFLSQMRGNSASEDFSVDAIVSVISSLVNEVDEYAEVDEAHGRIRVQGRAAAQERASAVLDVLRRAAGEPLRVEVEEFVLPAGVDLAGSPDAGTLASWRELDERGSPRLLALALDAGSWRSAEDIESVRGIVDIDVEIAQDSQIADPIVARIDSGARIHARAHPLMDGRVALRVLAGAAHLRGTPRRVAFGEDELGAVDLADFEGAFVSTELALTAGVAETVVMTRPNGARHVFVFQLAEAPAGRVGGTLRVLPYGVLTAEMPGLRFSVGNEPWLDGTPAFALEVDDKDGVSRLDRDLVREILEHEMITEREEGTAEVSEIQWMRGGAFAMRATSGALDRVEERLGRLEADLVRHARLTIRIEERPMHGGAGRVVGVLASPVPLDQAVALGAYRNAAYVADQDVEVAEKARISDPMTGSIVAGALANVVVSQAGDRSYTVALEMRVMDFDEPELLPFAALNVGSVERVLSRTAYTESLVRVTRGRATEVLVGRSPFGSRTPSRLVAVVTVE